MKVRDRVLLIRSSVGKVVMLTTLFSVKNAGHPHFMLGLSPEDAIENGYVKDEREWFRLYALFQKLHVSCDRTAHW
jgi:hypothetical protein